METDIMNLNTLWFVLISVLWIGYFFLEGFDFGVGILMPHLAEDDLDRRVIINTIGPVWDGNEVWLLVAGGATFAAFPEWYATLFSGFYLPLFLILVALIFRGVAFEFRGKDKRPEWRLWWDRAIFFGSALPALLWGVAFANIVRGVKIDATHEYVGGFFDLLNPYALLGGVVTLALFTLHGAVFLSLKTSGGVCDRAQVAAQRLSWPVVGLVTVFLLWTYASVSDGGIVPGLLPAAALLLLLGVPWILREGRYGWAFAGTGLTIALMFATMFVYLYPNVLPSNIDAAYSLDVYNAASSNMTLKVMSWVALIFTPLVIAYQSWSYWVFRKRIGREDLSVTSGG